MRTTTLPVLRPLCKQRNAAWTLRSSSKHRNGSPWATSRVARADSVCSTPLIQHGHCSIAASRARARYVILGDATGIRSALQTARFPISPKKPFSPRTASDPAMKSPDKLFKTKHTRLAQRSTEPPNANALPSRDESCLYGRPTLTATRAHSQCAYSAAARPTPPAPACSKTSSFERGPAASSAMCTVLHVVGSVLACSKVSGCRNSATSRASVRASEASAATPWPRTESPDLRRTSRPPSSATFAAQSEPGGPGSPG
eukprot:scaffold326825_cov52-Tisochrysis_lutea.AAC.2